MKNTKLSNLTFKLHQKKLHFLTQCYTKTNSNLKIALYRKPTDEQGFLHAKSEHSRCLNNSIPYSQSLRLKTICSTNTEHEKNFATIKQKFLGRQYKEEVLDEQIKKVDTIERKIYSEIKRKATKTEFHYQ